MKKRINNLIELAKNIRLLYIEDNDETKSQIKEQLEIFFKKIDTASNGKDGLEKALNNDYDLIITDIQMPKLNGLDMIKQLKEKKIKVKTLLLTAYDTNEYLKKALSIGVDGFLLKPIDFDQFLLELSKVVKNIQIEQQLNEYKNFLEEKLNEQYDELEEQQEIIIHNSKLAAMGEMIDIIAHQWKQPLNSIALRSNFLKVTVEDGIDITKEQIIECTDKVNDQINYLTDTLNHFRNFFRIEKNIKYVKLLDILENVKLLLKDNIIKNKIELIVDIEDDIYLNCIDNDLKNVFINLINNSRDAFIKNKTKDKKININARKAQSFIVIEIIDNAGGVKEELLPNIFKADFTTKKDMGGTGIGLYMLKLMANKYDISIDVKNYNDGLKFTFMIPYFIQKGVENVK